jgi:tetratricopeptide (TPR) repeat protein
MSLIKDVFGQIFRKPPPAGHPAGDTGEDTKLKAAMAHHQSGRLLEAENLYKEIIRADPEHADAIHLLGVIAHQGGHQQIALDLITEAIDIDSKNPLYYSNLGEAHLALWEIPEAIDCYESALEIAPDFVQAYGNLGNALKLQGNPDEAEAALQRAVSISPDFAGAHFVLGDLYVDRGDLDAAERSLSTCLELAPEHREAATLLALVNAALGNYDAAAEIFLSRLRTAQSPDRQIPAEHESFYITSVGKLTHDAEQLEYLVTRGVLPETFKATGAECTEIIDGAPELSGTHTFSVAKMCTPGFRDAYNRLHFHRDTPAIVGAALNNQLDFAAVEADFVRDGRRYTCVDDLLAPEALAELQNFCLESTIWYKVEYKDEVGTMESNGFSCPLLFQIIDELRRRLPNVIGNSFASQSLELSILRRGARRSRSHGQRRHQRQFLDHTGFGKPESRQWRAHHLEQARARGLRPEHERAGGRHITSAARGARHPEGSYSLPMQPGGNLRFINYPRHR